MSEDHTHTGDSMAAKTHAHVHAAAHKTPAPKREKKQQTLMAVGSFREYFTLWTVLVSAITTTFGTVMATYPDLAEMIGARGVGIITGALGGLAMLVRAIKQQLPDDKA